MSTHAKEVALKKINDYQFFGEDYHWFSNVLNPQSVDKSRTKIYRIDGLPGSGISTFLRAQRELLGDAAVEVEYIFSMNELTLIDHFSAALGLRSPHERLTTVPQYINEYIKFVGLKVVIIDDVDRFVTKPDRGQSIVKALQAICTAGSGLIILYSTRNCMISSLASRVSVDNHQEFWIKGFLNAADISAVVKDFLNAANVICKQDLRIANACYLQAASGRVLIGDLVTLLKSVYTHATRLEMDEIRLESKLLEFVHA